MPERETILIQRVTYALPSEIIYTVKDVADAHDVPANFIVESALAIPRRAPTCALW